MPAPESVRSPAPHASSKVVGSSRPGRAQERTPLKRLLWLMLGIALVAAGAYALRVERHHRAAASKPHADIDAASKRALDRILEQADRGEKRQP